MSTLKTFLHGTNLRSATQDAIRRITGKPGLYSRLAFACQNLEFVSWLNGRGVFGRVRAKVVPGREVMSKFASPTLGAAAPVPRRAFAGRARRARGLRQRALVRSIATSVLAIGAMGAIGGAGVAHAQDASGPIMIPGPAETNPAAVVAMARSAGIAVDGNGGVANA